MVSQPQRPAEVKNDPVFKDNLQAKVAVIGEGVRRKRHILCDNSKEAKRQRKHRQEIVSMLERELEKHPKMMPPPNGLSNHWLSRRIESHVKICVLALMIERIAERTCEKSWRYIRRCLEALQATTFF